jgi:hypothetical protein
LPVEPFFREISELSTKVEQLLKNENEEECESLLVQRHALLEQLAESVAKLTEISPSTVLSSQYREFLISIQKRDALSIKFAIKQRDDILDKRKKQEKGKKAIKAYQKSLL